MLYSILLTYTFYIFVIPPTTIIFNSFHTRRLSFNCPKQQLSKSADKYEINIAFISTKSYHKLSHISFAVLPELPHKIDTCTCLFTFPFLRFHSIVSAACRSQLKCFVLRLCQSFSRHKTLLTIRSFNLANFIGFFARFKIARRA